MSLNEKNENEIKENEIKEKIKSFKESKPKCYNCYEEIKKISYTEIKIKYKTLLKIIWECEKCRIGPNEYTISIGNNPPKPTYDWSIYPYRCNINESFLLTLDYLRFDGKIEKGERRICKKCFELNHHLIQGDPSDVCDCKTIFIDNEGNTKGQCCCWSYEHGTRRSNY